VKVDKGFTPEGDHRFKVTLDIDTELTRRTCAPISTATPRNSARSTRDRTGWSRGDELRAPRLHTHISPSATTSAARR
jgi:hypothetical protein